MFTGFLSRCHLFPKESKTASAWSSDQVFVNLILSLIALTHLIKTIGAREKSSILLH